MAWAGGFGPPAGCPIVVGPSHWAAIQVRVRLTGQKLNDRVITALKQRAGRCPVKMRLLLAQIDVVAFQVIPFVPLRRKKHLVPVHTSMVPTKEQINPVGTMADHIFDRHSVLPAR